MDFNNDKSLSNIATKEINFKENNDLNLIINLITEKMNSTNQDYKWTTKEYKEFKKYFCNKPKKTINLSMNSLIKCLNTPNSEIYQELKSFSNKVSWYPINERKKDSNTDKYYYIKKEIEISDCFFIIINLIRYIYQFINQYSNQISSFYNDDENNNHEINKIKEELIKEFDLRYQFLTDYPLFKDMYFNLREESILILTKNINLIKAKNNKKKDMSNKWLTDIFAQSHSDRKSVV